MDSYRKVALVTGALFIIATAASLAGTAAETSVLTGAGYLARVAGNIERVSLGALLELIAAGTSAGIALALYPVLTRWDPGLARGSVVFRAIEAVMYAVGALSLLSLVQVGRQFVTASTTQAASVQAAGDAFLVLRQEAVLAGVFAFVVGALLYYVVLLRSGLVPGWLAGWGIAGVALMLVACLGALFSGSPVTDYALLALPIAVQEMVLAVWLLARGFRVAAVRAERSVDAAAA